MSEELTVLEKMDKLLIDNEDEFLKEVRAELFAKLNYIKSLQSINKENIEELNTKVEKIIKLNELLAAGQAASQEMFVTLQHVGAIFNKMFDEISESAKDTDFVDSGAITKILNNNKKFEIDESVFEEEVLIQHSVDTSFEG